MQAATSTLKACLDFAHLLTVFELSVAQRKGYDESILKRLSLLSSRTTAVNKSSTSYDVAEYVGLEYKVNACSLFCESCGTKLMSRKSPNLRTDACVRRCGLWFSVLGAITLVMEITNRLNVVFIDQNRTKSSINSPFCLASTFGF